MTVCMKGPRRAVVRDGWRVARRVEPWVDWRVVVTGNSMAERRESQPAGRMAATMVCMMEFLRVVLMA